MKRNNPAATCFLQYDKLFIDHKVYVWNDVQGKVMEQVSRLLANTVFSFGGSFNFLYLPKNNPN